MKSSNGAIISIVVFCLLIIPGTLFASTLRISWNNNTEWDLAGYRIYYGTLSGAYGYVLDVGGSVCADIDGVEEDTVYFFAVTAYDLVGNESDFSREISVLIPEDQTGFLGVIVNWFFTSIGAADTGSDAPQYSLSDFYEVSGYIPVNTANIVRIDDSNIVSAEEPVEGGYIIKDAIIEADQTIDLATVYPAGTYTFVSLTAMPSEIIGGIFYAADPGAYLFMVQDMTGDLINIFRISVVDEFCGTADYLPGGDTIIDIAQGISLLIPQSASNTAFPMGIDCGGAGSNALSALSMRETSRVVFDIVPYGFILAEPAQVSVPYDGLGPVVVEVFDEATKQWTPIDDVALSDGVVTFSTTMLGSFKVYTSSQTDENLSYKSSGGEGGGCFIDSVSQCSRNHLNLIFILLATVMLGATLRAGSSQKRP